MNKPFFVRADPIAGESLYGYLCRLGEPMGYKSHQWINSLLPKRLKGKHNLPAIMVEGELPGLAEALQLSELRLDAMRLPKRQNLHFRKQHLNQCMAKIDPLYFCPACVRESGTHFITWHLNFVVACPTHNQMLLSRCHACDHQYDLLSVKSEICGFCSSTIQPIPVLDQHLTEAIDSLLSIVGGVSGNEPRKTLPPILEDANLATALQVVLSLGQAKQPLGLRYMRLGMEARLSHGFRMAQNWKESAHWMLSREASQSKARNSKGVPVFPAFKFLFSHHVTPTIRREVQAAIDRFASEYSEVTIEDISEARFIRLDVAARQLGITKVVLKKIGERSPETSRRGIWKKYAYIHREEIERLQACQRQCMSCKEAGRALGIPDRHQLRALYNDFVFPHADERFSLDHRAQCFQRYAIDAFLDRVRHLPEILPDPKSDIPWKTAKATFMSNHNPSVAFYHSVVRDELTPVGRLSSGEGFSSLLFRRSAVLALAKHRSTNHARGPNEPVLH